MQFVYLSAAHDLCNQAQIIYFSYKIVRVKFTYLLCIYFMDFLDL